MQKFFFNGRINLRMIRCFLVLAEELHFGKAAERLHISQPPLSAQIKEFEEVLGFRLFTRDSRNVDLTPAGIMMKEEMQQLLEMLENSLTRICQVGRYQQQHLNIGIIGSAIWRHLLDTIKQCQQHYPEMTWSLHELSPKQQQEALLKKSIDVGIWRCANLEASTLFTTQIIHPQKVMLAVHANNPLTVLPLISLEQLSHETFIFLTFKNSRFSQELHNQCSKLGVKPKKILQVNEPQTQMAMINNDLGIALTPEDSQEVPWPNVKFIPLTQSLKADLYAVYHSSNTSPALKGLLKLFPQ